MGTSELKNIMCEIKKKHSLDVLNSRVEMMEKGVSVFWRLMNKKSFNVKN